MPDSKLVIPHDIEGVFVSVIKARHAEHLAKAERERGVQPRTYEPFATVTRMSDAQALRLDGDTVPALLLGVIGAPSFVRNEDDGIDAVYQLGMQVTVMGKKRADVLLRRDLMAWTAIECIYQRVPRRGLINSIRLDDYEPMSEADSQRTLGDARMVWEVGVTNVLSIGRGIPADDSTWPAAAGGAPEQPYDPLEPYPEPTGSITPANFERKATVT